MPAKAIEHAGADPAAVAVGSDGVDLALEVGADILINPTVPVAHRPVTIKALQAGIPVLGEKPVTETLPEALTLVAHSEVTGVPFMVSQSRRFFRQVRQLRAFAGAHGPNVLTSVFFSMYADVSGYRKAEKHPELRDIGIHNFDAVRYILGIEPVAVTAREIHPAGSTYDQNATVTAIFEMEDDSLFTYNGSWDIRGLTTLWNGEWRIGLENGSATWDGNGKPTFGTEDAEETTRLQAEITADDVVEPDQIDASLIEFVTALREGREPLTAVRSNVLSFAMVEAASLAAETGERVVVDDLLQDALADAIALETDPEARAVLESWDSVREALAG
jgi:predicted dehydrogenase